VRDCVLWSEENGDVEAGVWRGWIGIEQNMLGEFLQRAGAVECGNELSIRH
jgi:hypothetical protein